MHAMACCAGTLCRVAQTNSVQVHGVSDPESPEVKHLLSSADRLPHSDLFWRVPGSRCLPNIAHREDPTSGVVAQNTFLTCQKVSRAKGFRTSSLNERSRTISSDLCDVDLPFVRFDLCELLVGQLFQHLQVSDAGFDRLGLQRGLPCIRHHVHVQWPAGIRIPHGGFTSFANEGADAKSLLDHIFEIGRWSGPAIN